MTTEKATEVAKDVTGEELDMGEALTSHLEEGGALETAVHVVEKIIHSVKPIQLDNEHVIMIYNSELVNNQTIAFLREVLETDANFSDGCHAVLFRNDGPPFEYDAEANKPISALGSYSNDALVAVINLEGIYEKASDSIIAGESCESLPAAVYHLINRTMIHELIHASEYLTTQDKYAWTQSPGEEGVEELAMLHLIERAKVSDIIELPADIAESGAWIDQKIAETLDVMRTGEGKKDNWEINQLYMVDNGKVFRSDDEEFGSMREYYRSMADDQDDPSWTKEVVEPVVEEIAITDPATMIGNALLSGNMADVVALMQTLNIDPPAQPVTTEEIAVGAAVPVDSPFIDIAQVGGTINAGAESNLLAEMMANTGTLAPQPISSEEQIIRSVFELLFNNMFDKCAFKQGHWTNPTAVLDPLTITIPGADQVIHSFDYTDGTGKYVKGELFGGVLKGQLDTRAGKLMRPAYVLHLKVGGIMVTRRLQPVYVLNENGTLRDIAPEKQATSLTYSSQQGNQILILRDPVAQLGKFNLLRQPDGSIKWVPWK